MDTLPFASSKPFSLGIKLELQLVKRDDCALAIDAHELGSAIVQDGFDAQIKQNVGLGMVEVKSGIHERADYLQDELAALRNSLIKSLTHTGIDAAGGGAHPFQCLSDQRIVPGQRFENVHERYDYLARTCTVFGQHIHVGAGNGDDALYLTHGFSRFVPHFIALSAASPFYKGLDTAFDSSRSDVVRTFPLAGTVPLVTRWRDFESCYQELRQIGLIQGMRDFYWDIRPKPEYGTVEIRVCDTPLTLEHAAHLGCYAQLLARWLLAERPFVIDDKFYSLYQGNRFAASRHGLAGEIAVSRNGSDAPPVRQSIFSHILECLHSLKRYATNDFDLLSLKRLRHIACEKMNDACRLRNAFKQHGSMHDVMRLSSRLWMANSASPHFR